MKKPSYNVKSRSARPVDHRPAGTACIDTSFEATLAGWDAQQDCWVFAYASLLWRPEFDASEVRRARLWGWHRALEMRSRVNRGTPECPGLVFALVAGGSCVGQALRIAHGHAEDELRRLWQREMPGGGVYTPRWLHCDTAQGPVQALAFTLARSHPSYTGVLGDAQLDAILRQAHGRYGSTLDYLLRTAEQLERLGIHDRKLARAAALGRRIAAQQSKG
jgi:cation transport protein ChaC